MNNENLSEQAQLEETSSSRARSSDDETAEKGADNLITDVNPNDILLGRGSGVNSNVGNVRFRNVVDQRRDEYCGATKEQKREIARQVLNEVHRRGGRFLQLNAHIAGAYEKASESKALGKCFHALREKKKTTDSSPVIPVQQEEKKASDKGADNLITDVNPNDILLGRGSGVNNNVGNVRFRDVVDQRRDEYCGATKAQKREIARQVLNEVHRRGGRFLQLNAHIAGAYEKASESKALGKCFHALREKKKTTDSSPVIPVQEEKKASGPFKRERQENETNDVDIIEFLPAAMCSIIKEQEGQECDTIATVLNSFRTVPNRPRMTQAEFEVEVKLLTKEEKMEAVNDVFGKFCTVEAQKSKQCKTSMDGSYVKSALDMMRHEMEWIPKSDKVALVEAQSRCCPDEFGDARLEAFLRSVDWHPRRAARRFAVYWEKRRQLFGQGTYHLPMTLRGALRDDLTALMAGVCVPLPRRDASGRLLIWYPVARNTFEGYTVRSMLRAVWYVIEVVSQQDTEIVRLGYFKDATMWNVDSELFCEHMTFTRDCWPVKVMADHNICVPQDMLRLMRPLVGAARSREMRIRAVDHNVPESEVIGELAKYGILPDMLPTDIGGTLEVSIDEWIATRRMIELEGTCIRPNNRNSCVDHFATLDNDLEELLDEVKTADDSFDKMNEILHGSPLSSKLKKPHDEPKTPDK